MMSEKDQKLEELMRNILTSELEYLASINIDDCDAGDMMEIMVSAHNVMESAKVLKERMMN